MHRIFLAALAGAALAGPAAAQQLELAAHPNLNLAGFSGDPETLPDAVARIETATRARVAEIRYDNRAGASGYDVALVRDGRLTFERIPTGADGVAPAAARPEAPRSLAPDTRLALRDLLAARTPLTDAIRAAEADHVGAAAVAAGLDPQSTEPNVAVKAHNVTLVQDGRQHRVAVDADIGLVISNPRAMNGWS